jgi:Zn-dependent peptidase ImmA (M78 family)
MTPKPDEAARALLERSGHTGLPVNLNLIINLWKNLQLSYDDLEGSGYLMDLGQAGGEIMIRRNDPIERQRYTIAHELAHWVLLTEYPDLARKEQRGVIERWCDLFASVLLIPEGIMLDYLRIGGRSGLADRIAKGHHRFAVSREAFRRRVTEKTPVTILEVSRGTNGIVIDKKYVAQKADAQQLESWVEEALSLGAKGMTWPHILVAGKAHCGSALLSSSGGKEEWLLCLYPSRNMK